MSKSKVERLAFFLLALVSLFFVPWWLLAIFLLLAIIKVRNFYELIIPALLFDSLFSFSGAHPFHFQFIMTVMLVITIYFVEELRGDLRTYAIH